MGRVPVHYRFPVPAFGQYIWATVGELFIQRLLFRVVESLALVPSSQRFWDMGDFRVVVYCLVRRVYMLRMVYF